MTSTQALNEIERYHDEEVYDVGGIYTENMFEKEIKIIRDDLEKLEKYEKIINILRWCPKTFEQLKKETDKNEYKEIIEELGLWLKEKI